MSDRFLDKIQFDRSSDDPVTGLISREEFLAAIRYVLESGRTDICLLFFDISQFKVYNRRNGRKSGDELLRALGQLLVRTIGSQAVFRDIGDHFFGLCYEDQAEDICRSIHEYFLQSRQYHITVRAGIYKLSADDLAGDIDTPLDRAMIAGNYDSSNLFTYMYHYDPKMESDLILSNYICSHIDDAVANGWIKVYYQPIVGIWNKKATYLEALSRWDDPEYGFLNPGEFIGALEQARLLYKLDMHVVESVCRDLRKMKDADGQFTRVSVNLSRHDLQLADLHERINDILERYRIPHQNLMIEITESALIDNEVVIQDHIRRFHKDGYKVWLDDFGSGYSSLNTLSKYDFDLIKIDMAFLREASSKTPIVIEDMVDMAKRLSMLTLTEGVEDKSQLEFLDSIGCSFAQGFYFSKPLPRDQLLKLMSEKGIGLEDDREFELYRDIRAVNILDVTQSTHNETEGLTERNSISVMLYRDGKYEMIYGSPEVRGWFHRVLKADSLKEVSDILNDPETALSRRVTQGIRRADKLDKVVDCRLNFPGYRGILRMKCISSSGDTRAYLNLLKDSEESRPDLPDEQVYKVSEESSYTAEESGGPDEPFTFGELTRYTPVPVFIYSAYDPETILYVNEACIREFGCSSFEQFMELTGGSFHTLVHPDDIEQVENQIWSQIREAHELPKRDYVAYRVFTKDRSVCYVQDAGMLVHIKRYGAVFFASLFFQDRIEENMQRNKQGQKDSVTDIVREVEKMHRLEQRLERSLESDGREAFTGLYSREAFTGIARSFYTDRKKCRNSALLLIELDKFGRIHTEIGQTACDGAIRMSADILKAYFRTNDLVSRFEGGLFCILIRRIKDDVLTHRIEQLLSALHETWSDSEHKVEMTASIGCLRIDPEGSGDLNFEEIFGRAFDILKQAKEAGGNCVRNGKL